MTKSEAKIINLMDWKEVKKIESLQKHSSNSDDVAARIQRIRLSLMRINDMMAKLKKEPPTAYEKGE